MTSLMARLLPGPRWEGDTHARVQVFAGPDPDHRALCGTLTMLPDEADLLIAVLAVSERTPQLVSDEPVVVLNPGTEPLADATVEQAASNMTQFIADVQAARGVTFLADRAPRLDDDEGRFGFRLYLPGGVEVHDVEMPGLPLERVRWLDADSGSIWDFPRLYVDGSSWVWKYAVSSVTPPEGAD